MQSGKARECREWKKEREREREWYLGIRFSYVAIWQTIGRCFSSSFLPKHSRKQKYITVEPNARRTRQSFTAVLTISRLESCAQLMTRYARLEWLMPSLDFTSFFCLIGRTVHTSTGVSTWIDKHTIAKLPRCCVRR